MRIYQNNVQLIGLGSAGTNIVEAFLSHRKTKELIQQDLTRLSLLAIDIADPEIRDLNEKYLQIEKSMVKAGIPSERMRLIAQSVKFPTAEAMFDFINQKFGEYLTAEGAKVNYRSWLENTMSIPPMAGGAGRRRALAKAIYALNYYQLGIIRNCINSFKEQALSSIITPTIAVIYGLGGGTGSGIFFDFVRHLRKVMGSGVPIIAFVITPCGGDDPPAKGCSAFVAMNELTLLLNKDYNEFVVKEYGNVYRNPLNALIYLPLLPAFSKVGNIVSARKELDDMVVDMLYTLMDFDLADLMGGIGTEVGLTNNAAHTIGMVKVVYPAEEYIAAYKLNFEGVQILQELRKDKLSILDDIGNIINTDYGVTRELFKNYLIRTETYNEEQFEDKLRNTITSNPRLEDDLILHVRGVEIQVKNWLSEIMKLLSTIRLMGKTGPIEESIINLTLHKEGSRKLDNIQTLLENLTKTYLEFREKKAIIVERLNQLIPSSQVFTLRQKKILEDMVNLAEIAERTLDLLQFYDETRYLTDALISYYQAMPESQSELDDLADIQTELSTLYLIIQLILRTPSDESKMIDEHLTYINGILNTRMQKRGSYESAVMSVQEAKKRRDFDKEKVDRQLRKALSSKRYAREQAMEIDRDLMRIETEESMALDSLANVDSTIYLYETLAKRFELTGEYRKKLNKIVDITNEYNKAIADILAPKVYYEKSADLTEAEQLRIIFKILNEQEETLTREVVAKEILDIDHYKDYIRSIIRSFKTPTIMGYKASYKTDYLWVTVVSPPNMWTEDMSQEIYTALAGYVTSEVSRSITVRVIESRDAWTTRVLVLAGRGKPEDMEAYDEMQLLYNKSSDFERHLSRSFLIEHGVAAGQIIREFNRISSGQSEGNVSQSKR